ncbi:MAG: sigma-70 family RNA polymerase sigma factor [Parcubacteria group bacterium]|nr:sigma-70 family RNA polymerase sigma factor [Parcubacteria group bacterium]
MAKFTTVSDFIRREYRVSPRELSAKEERKLLKAFLEKGDEEARAVLIESHLFLIARIAASFRCQYMFLDLMQEGALGLRHAIKKFDLNRAERLSTYGSFWIRTYMRNFIRENGHTIKFLPWIVWHKRSHLLNLKQKAGIFHLLNDEQAEAFAKKLRVRKNALASLDRYISHQNILPLDVPLRAGEERSSPFVDLLESPEPSPENVLADNETARVCKEYVGKGMQDLSLRERDIITGRFLSSPQKTLEELGQKYGVSRERVRQVEQAALVKMRKRLPRAEILQAIC